MLIISVCVFVFNAANKILSPLPDHLTSGVRREIETAAPYTGGYEILLGGLYPERKIRFQEDSNYLRWSRYRIGYNEICVHDIITDGYLNFVKENGGDFFLY